MTTIKATVSVGAPSQTIEGSSIRLETHEGPFVIGIGNDGFIYLSTLEHTLEIAPQAANRIHIFQRPAE